MLAPFARSAVTLLLFLAPQDRVPLAGGTGTLAAGAPWTVLREAEFNASERASDPRQEPARTVLAATVDALRTARRTAQHVVLHAPGTTGQLRLINCYHGSPSLRGSELRETAVIDQLRHVVEPKLQAEGVTVTYRGHAHPELFPVGCARLRFELRAAETRWTVDYHAVPAGEAMQFFETMYFGDDAGAEQAIETVLRTFDGARDPSRSSALGRMVRNGVIGMVAALVVFGLRRLRQPKASAGGGAAQTKAG